MTKIVLVSTGDRRVVVHRRSQPGEGGIGNAGRSHRVSKAEGSTNVCVEATVRAGFERDYYVIVPEDAVASWDPALHEATLANVRHRMGIVCRTADLIDLWKEAAG